VCDCCRMRKRLPVFDSVGSVTLNEGGVVATQTAGYKHSLTTTGIELIKGTQWFLPLSLLGRRSVDIWQWAEKARYGVCGEWPGGALSSAL
jgi:hypothetical protein